MAPPGTELVMGIQKDAQFGALVLVGLGGVMVESMRDVATGLAPVTPKSAAHARPCAAIRCWTGFRQQPVRDVGSALDTICRFSELAADLADLIEEADVNPVIVGTAGAVAADALLVLS